MRATGNLKTYLFYRTKWWRRWMKPFVMYTVTESDEASAYTIASRLSILGKVAMGIAGVVLLPVSVVVCVITHFDEIAAWFVDIGLVRTDKAHKQSVTYQGIQARLEAADYGRQSDASEEKAARADR